MTAESKKQFEYAFPMPTNYTYYYEQDKLIREWHSKHKGWNSAWQHQQQRIEELERENKLLNDAISEDKILVSYAKELEKKLDIAVDALNIYAKSSQSVPSLAIEVLKHIETIE